VKGKKKNINRIVFQRAGCKSSSTHCGTVVAPRARQTGKVQTGKREGRSYRRCGYFKAESKEGETHLVAAEDILRAANSARRIARQGKRSKLAGNARREKKTRRSSTRGRMGKRGCLYTKHGIENQTNPLGKKENVQILLGSQGVSSYGGGGGFLLV